MLTENRLTIRTYLCYLFLLLMLGAAWINSLSIQVFGLKSNPLLIPALLAGLILSLDWLFDIFIGFMKDRPLHFLPAILGITSLVEGESWLLRLPRLIYMVFIVSSISSLLNGYSLTSELLVRMVIFFLLMVVIPSLPEFRRLDFLRLGIGSFVGITGLSSLFALYSLIFNVRYELGGTVIGVWGKGVSGLYVNPNSAAIVSALALLAGLYLWRCEKGRIMRMFAAASIVTQSVVLVFSNSRTVLLGLILVLILYLVFFAWSKKQIDVLIMSLVVSMLVLFLAVRPYIEEHHLIGTLDYEQYDLKDLSKDDKKLKPSTQSKKTLKTAKPTQVTRPSKPKTELPWFYFEGPVPKSEIDLHTPELILADKLLSGRVKLAKEASLLWRTKPVTGYGFRHLYEAYSREVSQQGYLQYGRFSSAHNLFIDLLWMGGVVGLVLGLAFVFLLIKILYHNWRKQQGDNFSRSFYTLVFVFLLIHQMLEVSIITAFNLSTVCFWMLLPSLVSRLEMSPKHHKSESVDTESASNV